MGSRIPTSEQTHQRLEALLKEGVADGEARSELFKLAVRKIGEEALEAEVSDVLGRAYYESGAEPGRGYRSGFRRGRLRTAEGAIEYGVPQVADRAEPFVSRIRAGLAGRTAERERVAVGLFARGLSTRGIEAAFRDADGQTLLSRTAVRQVTERLWQEYEAFATRDLSEFVVADLFVTGSRSACTPGCFAKRFCVPGASPKRGARCCCTWLPGRRRTPRAGRPSSRT